MLKIYDGGSKDNDIMIWSSRDGIIPMDEKRIISLGSSKYKCYGNQIFLEFISDDGYDSEKVFSASIFFGIGV